MKQAQNHGAFQTWAYSAPSAKPRGFWHDDNPCDKTLWAWAPIVDGVVKLGQGKSGFETRQAAVAAAADEIRFAGMLRAKLVHGAR